MCGFCFGFGVFLLFGLGFLVVCSYCGLFRVLLFGVNEGSSVGTSVQNVIWSLFLRTFCLNLFTTGLRIARSHTIGCYDQCLLHKLYKRRASTQHSEICLGEINICFAVVIFLLTKPLHVEYCKTQLYLHSFSGVGEDCLSQYLTTDVLV